MIYNFGKWMKTAVLVMVIECSSFKYIMRMVGCSQLSIIHFGRYRMLEFMPDMSVVSLRWIVVSNIDLWCQYLFLVFYNNFSN